MSATRYSQTGEFKPEAKLASSKIRGVNVGLNIVIKVARAHDEPMRRAMIWLTNYAIIREVTADALSAELDLEKATIRAALTDPDFEEVEQFVDAVNALRAAFEAKIKDKVDTAVRREVDRAMRFALRARKMIEIIGKTRMGKSDCARVWWLRNLDRVLWFECPEDSTTRGFFFALAECLGIGISNAKKTGLLREQCKAVFGEMGIQVLIVDEGHRLWPADTRSKPERIEFLRAIYRDGLGCSVVVIATPQHTESVTAAISDAGRWAPGQWVGRVIGFHLDDTMPREDLAAVARFHAPGADKDVVEALVEGALASEGYCGAMVNVIELALEVYSTPGQPLTEENIVDAQIQMEKGNRIVKIAQATKAPRRRAA